jgi:hypothetical protein
MAYVAQKPDCIYLEIWKKNVVIFIAVTKYFSLPSGIYCADRRISSVRMHDWK